MEQFHHIHDAREATGAGYFLCVATADARFVQALVILQQEKGYVDAEIKAAINRG